MERTFEIWNHQSFDMDGFALLVETRNIIRGVYNNEPAIVTDLTKQEIIDMYNEQYPDSKIQPLQAWAKYENIGQTPDYIFSDEDQTIILNGEIYETYADLIADIYEDHACARIDGEIVWRDDDYEAIELTCEPVKLNQGNQFVFPWAGITVDGKVLVMIYSNWEHSSDVGKVFSIGEFVQYCEENGYDDPFAKTAKDDRITLVYDELGVRIELGKILTNHSVSVDDALRILGIDMDAFAAAQGWDGWNYEALKLEY